MSKDQKKKKKRKKKELRESLIAVTGFTWTTEPCLTLQYQINVSIAPYKHPTCLVWCGTSMGTAWDLDKKQMPFVRSR